MENRHDVGNYPDDLKGWFHREGERLKPWPRPEGGKWETDHDGTIVRWVYPLGSDDLYVHEGWVETAIGRDGRWMAALRIISQNGAPVIGELRIFPNEPDRLHAGYWSNDPDTVPFGGLTTTEARVPLQSGREAAHAVLRDWRQRMGPNGAWVLDRAGYQDEEVERQRKRRGRPSRFSDRDLAVLCRRYAELIAAGSRRPREELAAERGESGPWVRERIQQAARRGLWSKPPAGVIGGALTEKAERILQSVDQSS